MIRVFLLLLLLLLQVSFSRGQEAAPLVAKLQMRLTLNDEVIDVIEQGDLLTVLAEREDAYIIQTISGQKGAVAKGNAVPMAEAVPIFDELIEGSPDEGRLYTLRASAKWAAGKIAEALADYDQAIELGYTAAHAYASRGLFHAAMQNHERAIADYTLAIEKDPDDEVPLINRAAVYMAQAEFSKAVEDYSQAIERQAENPILYIQRAVAYKVQGDLERAIEDYDRALALSDEDVSAWMGRGFLNYQLGKHEAAIADFTKAIELAPQNAVAFNNRGYNRQLIDKHQAAIEDFKRAVELAPQYLLALQNLAWALTTCEDKSLREPERAIELAKTVCEMTEYESVSDLTLLAAAYAAADEYATAIGWQEKAGELSDERQAKLSERILELYRNEQPLDPQLLEDPAAEKEKSNQSKTNFSQVGNETKPAAEKVSATEQSDASDQ